MPSRERLLELTRLRLIAGRPYFAVFLISSVIVSRWFVPGTFISTGDMGPWIRQGWEPEATSSWNHTVSGAGSAAFTVARGFEFFVLKFVGIFGGDEYVGQWLFYTLIYGLVAVGTTYAARSIVRNEPAAVAAGTFAVLSGFFLTRLPNPLNIISVGSIALLTGLAIRVARGRTHRRAMGRHLPAAHVLPRLQPADDRGRLRLDAAGPADPRRTDPRLARRRPAA